MHLSTYFNLYCLYIRLLVHGDIFFFFIIMFFLLSMQLMHAHGVEHSLAVQGSQPGGARSAGGGLPFTTAVWCCMV